MDDKIVEHLIEIKSDLAMIKERLNSHIEWEEKKKHWYGNTLFPVLCSAVISFCISLFK